MPRRQRAARKPSPNSPSKGRGRGRPTSFRPEHGEQVERLLRLYPATDEEIAAFLGKSPATITTWKAKHPEFREAIRRGKTPADVLVSESLHKRALGFELHEQQAIKVRTVEYAENGRKLREVERVEIVTVKKTVPPDTMAGMYWLNNRQREHWRQRQEVTGKDGKPLVDLNLDEVRAGIESKLARIAAAAGPKPVPGGTK